MGFKAILARIWGGDGKTLEAVHNDDGAVPDDELEFRATMPAPPPPDSYIPDEDSAIRRVRSRTGPQALKVIFWNLLASDKKTAMWPLLFLEYTADILVASRKYDGVDFDRVFRERKEDADKKGPTMKMYFLTSLAIWLEEKKFSRTRPGNPPEPDWTVMPFSGETLEGPGPKIAANREGARPKSLEVDDKVPLYDVFSGLKMELPSGATQSGCATDPGGRKV